LAHEVERHERVFNLHGLRRKSKCASQKMEREVKLRERVGRGFRPG
jgi:hypothetical protein